MMKKQDSATSSVPAEDVQLTPRLTLQHGTPRKNWFYTHGSHISNIKSIAAEIKAALAYYRKVSAKRNKCLLGVYIDAITKAEFTDELITEETSQEDWREEQMNAVRYLVDAEMDQFGILKPPDLLVRSDRFAAVLSLDGTSHATSSRRAAPRLQRHILTLSAPL